MEQIVELFPILKKPVRKALSHNVLAVIREQGKGQSKIGILLLLIACECCTVHCVNKHYPSNCPVKRLIRVTPNAESEASILGLKESIYGASRESPEF